MLLSGGRGQCGGVGGFRVVLPLTHDPSPPAGARGGMSCQLWFPVSFLLRRMTGGRIRAVAAALCVPLPES